MWAAEVEDTDSFTYSFYFYFNILRFWNILYEPRHQHELGFLLLSVDVTLVYFLIY